MIRSTKQHVLLGLSVAIGISLALGSSLRAEFNPSEDYAELARRLTRTPEFSPDATVERIVQGLILKRIRETGCVETGTSALCVWPGESEERFQAILDRLPTPHLAYTGTSRWTKTATNGIVSALGTPITLTYSFVPDGLNVVGKQNEPNSPSNLFASFDAAFGGNRALWKSKFAEAFNAWAAVTGVTYVEVPDDGAVFFDSPGVLGSRGDLRIAAHNIDGTYGILGYTFYPNGGDMVFDSSEAWGNGSTQLFFRNTCVHEHGHGLGIGHVYPLDHTKVMEPFLNTNFDGPQDDDIRGVVRNYGDKLEANSTAAAATNLGVVGASEITKTNLATFGASDVDWFKLTASPSTKLTVQVFPVGSTYETGPSSTNVSTINTQAINDLKIDLYASNGLTLLFSQNLAGTGQTETLADYPLAGGVYYVTISNAPGSVNDVQRYDASFACAPANTPPSITSVALSPGLVAAADSVQVTVEIIDPEGLQGVTANGVPLSISGGHWQGSIIAAGGLTTHTVTVVATDLAGATDTDVSASYRDTRILRIQNKAIQYVPESSQSQYLFKVAGRVMARTPTTFDISDGSNTIVRVTAPGHSLQVGDYASARGPLNKTASPPTISSITSQVSKLN